LRDPETVRIGRDTCDVNLARTQVNEEEYIEGLEPNSFDGEEITGKDLGFVMAHEMTPTDGAIANRGRLDAMAVKNIANGGLRDLETQFDELTLDFAIPPTEIFYSQTEYQAFKFMRDLRTSPPFLCG
jgi:hypothetical protein